VGNTVVRDNGGHGIHLGDADQSIDVAAMIDGAAVSGNLGVGILVEQDAALSPGADCGAGCTGATVVNNAFHDNAGAGVELRSGFIIPLFIPTIQEDGLGFLRNRVSHNAMAGPGCAVEQTAPEIFVSGPVGFDGTDCASATSELACEEKSNSASNGHCVFVGNACRVAWDLRGGIGDNCPTGTNNSIFGYNISDSNSPESVGLRAIGGAIVDASNNEWQSSTNSDNVSSGSGAAVVSDQTCVNTQCGG
jgi:hypothetical protein